MSGLGELPRQRHDLRLLGPALATWLAAGVALGLGPAVAYGLAAAGAVAAVVVLVRQRRTGLLRQAAGRSRVLESGCLVSAVLACAAASALGAGLRGSAVASGPVRELAHTGQSATLEAVVTGDPQTAKRVVLLRARAVVVSVRGRRVGVRVPVLLIAADRRWLGVVPSQRVRFMARLAPPRGAELLAAAAIVRGPPIVLGPPSALQRGAEKVRASLRRAVEELPKEQRGVLPGMVVGDTSQLDPRLAEEFRTAGLSHLLVVSGANLAIVIGGVLWACRWLGLGRRLAPMAAGLAVVGFVIVARPEPSVLRATVMGMIGLLAMLTGRQRQGLPALCAAVLLLVLIDPSLARSYGFALSVLATAGLLVLAPVWRERLRRRMPAFAAEALAVAGAAEVAVAPVLVMLSGEVGLVSVVANLLAAPAVAPATLLGVIAGVTAPFALPVARIVVWPAGLAAGWIVWVARTASGLPYAVVPWPGGALGALTLIVGGCGAVVLLRWRRVRMIGGAAMAGVLIAVIGLRVLAPGWPPPGWLFVACDVGQGDGLVLSAGPGQAVVVDAGPDPALMDACLTRLRVRDVPLLVFSHPHADHVDGAGGVRHGRTVGTVVTTPRTSGREARFVSGLIMRAAAAGQRWTVGDLTLEVLGPLTDGPHLLFDDDGTTVNNASVVMVARRPGFSVLLPGDVETEAQRALAASVPHVQVLKVPHHGSRSQDPAFLAAAHASISIVSVGRDNDYGHPASATIALLQRLGTRVYRTDLNGDIAVTRTAGGLAVVPHHS